ncbi:MAG TPA: sulfite exporter TauE/SafE family protein [Dongiaceae bacterium]|jgi:hypothetical protein
MDLIHVASWLYSVAGFCVGFLVGITGVGGGSLMTPLLILAFGVHPSIAVGTDLLYAAVTKTGGTLIHGLHRTIEWRVVGRLAAGSVPVAALTLLFLSYFDITGEASHELITKVLSAALFVTAAVLIFRSKLLALRTALVGDLDPRRTAIVTVAFGGILGLLVSVSSVGAGAIGVTALALLYPQLPIRRIVGSDIAHAVPLTLVAGIGHWIMGSTNWHLLGLLLIGSLPGVLLGGRVSIRVPDTALRLILAGALILTGAKLLF